MSESQQAKKTLGSILLAQMEQREQEFQLEPCHVEYTNAQVFQMNIDHLFDQMQEELLRLKPNADHRHESLQIVKKYQERANHVTADFVANTELGEFAQDQWWVEELQKINQFEKPTHDQIRSVAVVMRLVRMLLPTTSRPGAKA